jgi:hypothetical protein
MSLLMGSWSSRVVVPSAQTTSALRIGRVWSLWAASRPCTYAVVASMSAHVNDEAITVTEGRCDSGLRCGKPCRRLQTGKSSVSSRAARVWDVRCVAQGAEPKPDPSSESNQPIELGSGAERKDRWRPRGTSRGSSQRRH